MTPVGVLFVVFCCVALGAFVLGYTIGRLEEREGWWSKRRELLRRVAGAQLHDGKRNPW